MPRVRRRFTRIKQPAWFGASIATPFVVLGLSLWPDTNGLSVRLLIASAVLFGYVAALAAHALGDLPESAVTESAAVRDQKQIGDLT